MKHLNLKYIFLSIFTFFIFFSCSKDIGYSIVLWGDDNNQLKDGEIVKVLVKSNITHTYIIENPNGQDNFEVPIWRLTEPESKSQIKKTVKLYAEYINKFASVKLDGLPIRADSINTAKQVYKLRKNEIIRILYKGEGAAVENKNGNIEGNWYRVLTADGTQGWCFSHNLDIYESENGGKREKIEVVEDTLSLENDGNLKILKENRWYPGEYRSLIKKNVIDLHTMDLSYGFIFNEKNKQISLSTATEEKHWKFNNIKKLSSKQFQFDGANVNITVRSKDEIIVQYMENGKPKNSIFASFDEDISKIISAEQNRRNKAIQKIKSSSAIYSSANYGSIEISGSSNDYNILWKNFNLLVPNVIDSSAKEIGKLSIEYLISDSLKSSYDGILTIRFNGTKKENNFLYKLTSDGLRLEDANSATIKDNVVTKRASSPTVIFFEKN